VTVAEANQLADRLIAKGYLVLDPSNEADGPRYRVLYARMRKQNIPCQLL
jgi:hypothetical protein